MIRRRYGRRRLPLGLALVALVLAPACRSPQVEELAPGRSWFRNLGGGETLSFRLAAEAGELIEVAVEQQGVDVVVALDDPGGERLVEVDGWLGTLGTERVLWVADRSGDYQLEIRSPERSAEAGALTVRAEEPGQASDRDRRRADAAAAFYAAKQAEQDRETAEARGRFESSIEVWAELGEAPWLAEVYHSLGHLELFSGELEPALEAYTRAVEWAGDDLAMAARTRINLGEIHLRRDRLEVAREQFQLALDLFEKTTDRGGEALALNKLGFASILLRESSEALRFYRRGLDLNRELGDRIEEAIALNNMGWAYARQGNFQRAADDFLQALAIREAEAARAGGQDARARNRIARTLNGLGFVALHQRRLDEALETFERALDLRGSDGRGRALTLGHMGEVYAEKGELDEARRLFDEALRLFREVGDRRGEAAVLEHLGRLQDASDPSAAIELYRQALALSQSFEDRDGVATGLFGLARARRQQGELQAAKEHMEAAVRTIEELRLRPDGDDLRASYFAGKQEYFDFYVDLLMELAGREEDYGYLADALAVSERSRSRSLLDSLAERGTDVRGEIDPRLLDLERRLEAGRYELTRLLLREAPEEQVKAVKRELEEILDELDIVRSSVRESHPVYAALSQPRPLSAEEIQSQILDPDTVLLTYQMGKERSFLWAVTTDSLTAFELRGQDEIEPLARRAYKLLTSSYQRQYRAATRQALGELSELLLAPAAERLDRRRVLIVAEGALLYIPFAVLPDPAGGGRPLVAGHEVVSLPSASILSAVRRQAEIREPPSLDVAVLADPVFDLADPRMAGPAASPSQPAGRYSRPQARRPGEELPPERLSYAGLEARAILELAEGGENLAALDFRATKEKVSNGELSRYRYIHIATHGLLDPEFPDLSSLVFSLVDPGGGGRDGYLYTHDIYRLDLRADLVALSACQTARGREVRGEGIVGWTQGFLYSGAQRVLVSLWNVDDEATAELMKHFYRRLLREGRSPAAALRLAQEAIRQSPEWHDPYYWAGFVLQGEYL